MNTVDCRRDLDSNLSRNSRVLALFFSSWCPFCQEFLPTFDRKVKESGFGEVLYVQIDDYDNALWEEYSIDYVPTLILFEHGTVSTRLDGKSGQGLSEREFCEWLCRL